MSNNPWGEVNSRISHQTLIRLQSVYSSLKNAEKKAADFLLEHPDKVERNTITEVAELADCSEATLVRIAKKLTYSGYPELRASIMRPEGEVTSFYENISEEDGTEDMLRKVFAASVQAINDTLNMMDMGNYHTAIDLLNRAGRVMLVGNGDAWPVALSGCQKFSRIGIDVSCPSDFDSQLICVAQLKPGDVLIAVSHSGRTRNIIEVVKRAVAGGVKVVAVTNFPVSPLAKHADVVLLTAAFLQNAMGEVMTKRITELCIIESIYVALARMNPERTVRALEQTGVSLEANKL